MGESSPLTLIQLVSEQTMQNLLPVLRLRPSRLLHLATPRTIHRSADTAEAARESGCPVELETIKLSTMPSMRETHAAVLRVIERESAADREIFVNFTGGTKLMGIGAYVAALKHKTPSFYVDTQNAAFVDGQTAEGLSALLSGDLSFTPILEHLTVNVVGRANGCTLVSGGRDWLPYHALATRLLENSTEERQCHELVNGTKGIAPILGRPRKPVEWLAALDTDLPLPPEVCRLALATDLFIPGSEPETVRLPDAGREELRRLTESRVEDFGQRLFRAVAPLQDSLNILGGAWWEIVVVERMRASGRFRDLRWSVQVGEKGGPTMEEDVVALDGVQVVCVSCKRGGAGGRLLPQLNELNARAASLGGSFTRRFLTVRNKARGAVLRNLEKRAGELGIRLLFPENFDRADPFG